MDIYQHHPQLWVHHINPLTEPLPQSPRVSPARWLCPWGGQGPAGAEDWDVRPSAPSRGQHGWAKKVDVHLGPPPWICWFGGCKKWYSQEIPWFWWIHRWQNRKPFCSESPDLCQLAWLKEDPKGSHHVFPGEQMWTALGASTAPRSSCMSFAKALHARSSQAFHSAYRPVGNIIDPRWGWEKTHARQVSNDQLP